jgi:hypothetical protein
LDGTKYRRPHLKTFADYLNFRGFVKPESAAGQALLKKVQGENHGSLNGRDACSDNLQALNYGFRSREIL